MRTFTEAYQKGVGLLKGKCFDARWSHIETRIHELSHKLVDTDDRRYDFDGIKPGASISSASSIENAESRAYLVADLVGALPDDAFKEGLQMKTCRIDVRSGKLRLST
jgi:hypothetical protein